MLTFHATEQINKVSRRKTTMTTTRTRTTQVITRYFGHCPQTTKVAGHPWFSWGGSPFWVPNVCVGIVGGRVCFVGIDFSQSKNAHLLNYIYQCTNITIPTYPYQHTYLPMSAYQPMSTYLPLPTYISLLTHLLYIPTYLCLLTNIYKPMSTYHHLPSYIYESHVIDTDPGAGVSLDT